MNVLKHQATKSSAALMTAVGPSVGQPNRSTASTQQKVAIAVEQQTFANAGKNAKIGTPFDRDFKSKGTRKTKTKKNSNPDSEMSGALTATHWVSPKAQEAAPLKFPTPSSTPPGFATAPPIPEAASVTL